MVVGLWVVRRIFAAALEAGAEPETIAAWTRDVETRRAAAQAEITNVVNSLGGLLPLLRQSEPGEEAGLYRQLGYASRMTIKKR